MTPLILTACGLLSLWLAWRLGALDSLSATITASIGWQATKNITGSDYSSNQNNSTIRKTMTIGTTVANAVAGGGDELYSAVTSLAPSASLSLDLTSFADILSQSGISLARVKAILIRVLSTTDDSVIGTAATPCMIDCTVANALLSQSGSGWFKAATSTFDIPNGGFIMFGTPAAAGVLIDGTHKVVKVTCNDGSLTAKLQVTAIGGST